MAILSTKLRNAIRKANVNSLDISFYLRNVSINGTKKGCTGFVVNNDNGSIIYVDTEEFCLADLHFMYRYADHLTDFTGYHNRWADTLTELAEAICKCLEQTPKEAKDFRV